MSLRWKAIVAALIWTGLIAYVFLTKHPRISTILTTPDGQVHYPPPPDNGAPQLAAWLIGLGVIAAVSMLLARQARP